MQDDAFLMPAPDTATIDAVMAAYRDAGIRASVALDQPELPETDKLPFLADLASTAPPDVASAMRRPGRPHGGRRPPKRDGARGRPH